MRPGERVAAYVAEVLGSEIAPWTTEQMHVPRARHLERLQVEDVSGHRGAKGGIADQVEPPKTLAASVEVSFKIVRRIVGRAAGQRKHSIQRPSLGELGRPGTEGRNLIVVVPAQPIAYIEIGVRALEIRTKAVVRLRSLWHEIQPIARVIDGMRPGVVHGRGQPVPALHRQHGLQRVVARRS